MYARLILHLAQKHSGQGWLDFDNTIRSQAAADLTLWWNAINPSLMASAVLSNANSGTYCHHWQKVDHRLQDCTLLAVDPSLNTPTPPRDCRPPTPPGPLCPRVVPRPSPYDHQLKCVIATIVVSVLMQLDGSSAMSVPFQTASNQDMVPITVHCAWKLPTAPPLSQRWVLGQN